MDKRLTERPPPAAGAGPRAAAALALHRVRHQGQSLTRALDRPPPDATPADRALTQELTYGALRLLPRLEALAACLLKHPLRPRDRDLGALILIGLYELLALRTPPHAAVDACVEASRRLGKPERAALVNALLRRFLRERETLLAEVERQPEARWMAPAWLLERLRQDWPDDWEAILAASDERPPMSLRVNPLRIDRDDYLAQLTAAGIAARPLPDRPTGLILEHPRPTRELPGFAEGLVSVQDSGAQLAALLLDARPGQRVLDACAAPGGKTAHLLERAGQDLDLIALDSDADRLQTLKANLDRLGLRATILRADAAAPTGDWTQAPFDRILLDAPCSATGVMRRHPDIKWLRRPGDIPALANTQSRLLAALWPLLAPGGRLLYATCSLLAEENQARIAAFLAATPDARERPLATAGGRSLTHGRQWLPESGGQDGFYHALLEKVSP